MAESDDVRSGVNLLIEAAGRREREADAAVERIAALARDLEQIVRDEIRGAFVEEFAALGEASRRAGEALHVVRRTASLRIALWSAGVAAACCVMPIVIARTLIPTPAEIVRLRGERDALAADVAQLARHGGRVDLRRCGASGRLCVRVDRSAPTYGTNGDYYVIEGRR